MRRRKKNQPYRQHYPIYTEFFRYKKVSVLWTFEAAYIFIKKQYSMGKQLKLGAFLTFPICRNKEILLLIQYVH